MAADIGKVGWIDMTTRDAESVRDFYAAVVGFEPQPVSMGDYDDYNMTMPGSGEAVAGICHARGSNADLPGGWLVYFTVADVDASCDECRARGGRVAVEPRGLAGGRFAVVEDPGGGFAAIYQA